MIIGSGWIFFNLITPLYDEINKIQGEIQSKEIQYSKYKAIYDQYKKVESDYNSRPEIAKKLNEAVPNDPLISQEINQIAELAFLTNSVATSSSSGGIRIKSIDIKEDTAKVVNKDFILKPTVSIKAAVNFSSSYEAAKTFIQFLEQNVRLINLLSYDIKKEEAGAGNYTSNLNFQIYYQK